MDKKFIIQLLLLSLKNLDFGLCLHMPVVHLTQLLVCSYCFAF